MARNFGNRNSNTSPAEKTKAVAFTNFHMPKADGSAGQKLAYIVWEEGDEAHEHIAKNLLAAKAKGDRAYTRALEVVLSSLVITTNSGETAATPVNLFDFSETAEDEQAVG